MTATQTASAVPFLDLASMHDEVRDELDLAWKDITRTNAFIGGAAVEQFEHEWAAYCGAAHCVGVANGTDALEAILAALDIGQGDEVIVPANTFIATAEAVVNVGATPIWVDVDPDTLLLRRETVEPAVTARTAAVMAVHLYGQMADVDALGALCAQHDLALIEDAAQAHGARWNQTRAGSTAVAAGFSFYPGKNLGAFGDAGAVVTDDAVLAERIRGLVAHGRSATSRYEHIQKGRNSRLDGLQAAVLAIKLRRLEGWNAERRRVHAAYAQALDPAAGIVAVHPEAEAVHHLEVVRVRQRERLAERLAAAAIGSGIHYPIACHRQPAFAEPGAPTLAVAEAAAATVLSLPMSPHLTNEQVHRVAEVVNAHVADVGSPNR